MFAAPAVAWSTTDRAGWPHLLAEVVATAGLVLVIFALVRTGRSHLAAPAVGAYIGAAYFFTSSTSFANPAITIGRVVHRHLRRHRARHPSLPFIGAQLVGAALGWAAGSRLLPGRDRRTGGIRRLMTALPRPRTGLAALAIAQVVAWGVLYYAVLVAAPAIAADTGWDEQSVFIAITAGLLTSAVCAIPVGRWLDRHPRRVMVGGAIVATFALLCAAASPSIWAFAAAWIVCGAAQAAVLYQAAFTVITHRHQEGRRGPLTVVTLAGGLASTVFAPTTAWLVDTDRLAGRVRRYSPESSPPYSSRPTRSPWSAVGRTSTRQPATAPRLVAFFAPLGSGC